MLNCRTVTYFEVDYQEVERLVKETYKVDYDLPSAEEFSNGMCKTYSIKRLSRLHEYDKRQLDTFMIGKNSNIPLHTLLNDLCIKEKIEPGEYLIEVCW